MRLGSVVRARGGGEDAAGIAALALAQAVVVAMVIAIGAAPTGGASPIAYGFALASGTVVLAASRFPIPALLGGVGIVVVYYVLDLPAIGVGVPILGTVYLASLSGYVISASATALVLIALSVFFRVVQGSESSAVLSYDTVTNLALIAATVALAAMLRARRAAAVQHRRVMQLEHSALARRMDDERLQISRDLHDSLGHRLVTVAVYAGVAAEAHDDGARASALRHVQDGTRTALEDLRAAVRAVRTGAAPVPLDDLEAVVTAAEEALRITGLDVRSSIDPGVADLTPGIRQAAARIVQEAATNILKHADAQRASIEVRRVDGMLVIRVQDNGHTPSSITPGAGIRGMHERAAALTGEMRAELGPDGFVVEARLPERRPE